MDFIARCMRLVLPENFVNNGAIRAEAEVRLNDFNLNGMDLVQAQQRVCNVVLSIFHQMFPNA